MPLGFEPESGCAEPSSGEGDVMTRQFGAETLHWKSEGVQSLRAKQSSSWNRVLRGEGRDGPHGDPAGGGEQGLGNGISGHSGDPATSATAA